MATGVQNLQASQEEGKQRSNRRNDIGPDLRAVWFRKCGVQLDAGYCLSSR